MTKETRAFADDVLRIRRLEYLWEDKLMKWEIYSKGV
jgi:hypothetical protein